MENYSYPYPPAFTSVRPPDGELPDHGDGFGQYYGLSPLNEDREDKRPVRSKQRRRKQADTKRSRSRSRTVSQTRSKSRTPSRSRSRSRTRSLSRSRSVSHCRSSASRREFNFKEPGFLDAFRVLYLTPSKHKKSTTRYLTTKKRQDRIQELIKGDGLGSKRWFFYPRSQAHSASVPDEVPGIRDNCDQRIKVDGEFFRKYKRSKKVNADAPIAKLKRWELIFYKKLGFIQAV